MKIDELLVGGALSLPFTILYDAVKLAVKTNNAFKSLLQDLNSTMESLNPHVEKAKAEAAAAVAQNLQIPEEAANLKKLMEKGESLVNKCSQVPVWNLFGKYSKSDKLRNLNQEIRRYFWLDIPMRILTVVNQLKLKLEELDRVQSGGDKGRRYVNLKNQAVVVYRSPDAPELVVGMDGAFEELKEKLLQKGFSGHVVSGMGGYGKTTLASRLIHHQDVKETFKNNIFFLCVSESQSSLTVMVQQMFSKIDKENAPDIATEEEALDKLQELLTKIGHEDPVLVVLDDVWPKYQDVLEKFELQSIPHYKILVTSRYAGFNRFGPPLQLEGLLTDEDALKLFLHSAKPSECLKHLEEKSLQYQIAKEIVEQCKKSPLALTVVGSSLSGCWNDLQQWKNKRDQLSEGSSSLVRTESKILHCLEKSLHDLSSTQYKLKECFMDLGLFPQDHKIPARVLIDVWDELYELGANGVHAVAILHQLLNRNLLHLVCTREDQSLGDGFYGNLYVKQHDLLRQLAINQNSKEQIDQQERIYLDIRNNIFPKWFKEGNKALKARVVSICTDSLFSSTWPDDVEFPAIEVLILNFQTKKYSLPPFMQKMVTLKTLVVIKNGFGTVEPSNFDIIASSLPKLKKIRFERIQLPNFLTIHTTAPPVFKNLEKLSFFMCSGISNVLSLCEAFPKLEEIEISYCREFKKLPDGICEVKSLKKISINDCHNLSELPSEIGKLKNVEVLRVTCCASLESLPDSIAQLNNLGCLNISGCRSIWKLPKDIGGLESLKELQMNGCGPLDALPKSVNKLEKLKRVICDEEGAYLWMKKRLDGVIVIQVQNENNLGFLQGE